MAAAVARHVGARFVVITDVSRVPARPGPQDGRRPRARRLARDGRRRAAATRHGRGLRRRAGDERAPDRAARRASPTSTTAAGSPCSACPAQPIEIDWAKVVTHMITIKGIYGREMYETWYAMSAMLRSGLDISAVITHRLPADGVGRRRSPPRAAASAARSSSTGREVWHVRQRCGEQLQTTLDEIRDAGLYKNERQLASPQSAHVRSGGARRAELLRQQLPRPGRPPGRRRGGQAGAGRVGLRDGQRAVHLRHADPAHRARAPAVGVPAAPRRRSCTRRASTPTAACSRCCSTSTTR